MKLGGSGDRMLVEIIERLQGLMGEYNHDLAGNEALTRYVLIDPLLRALSWDTEDPEKVYVEYRTSPRTKEPVDYALMQNGKPVAFVEAKKFGGCQESDLPSIGKKLFGYCNLKGVSLGILTDGGSWHIYNIHKPVPFEEQRLLLINFVWDADRVARECLRLTPSRIKSLLQPT